MLNRAPCAACGHDHGHRAVGTLMVRILLGTAFLANAFLSRWFYTDNPLVGDVSAALGGLVLMIPVLVMAFRDLRKAEMHMSGLVALAVLAAFAQGNFLTAGLIALFMLAAIVIETRTAEGAHASIEKLIRLAPTRAGRLGPDGAETVVGALDLLVGDRIRVRPGETIAVDGVIEDGQATLNEATVTGESLPADKGPGAHVFAGTHNLTGTLVVRVSRVGEDTTLGRVRALILAAEESRLPVTQTVDRFVRYYFPAVLLIALLVWVTTGAVDRVVALLVIACPCALVLAAPTAMVAALTACARLGILVKNVADLDLAGRLTAFVFDKTGTLTSGHLVVARLAPAAGVPPADLLGTAAAAEQFSKHPVALALLALAQEAHLAPAPVGDFQETAGLGVRARVGEVRVLVGRARWLVDQGVPAPAADPALVAEQGNYSVLWVARDGVCLGWIGFADQVRESAAPCLRELAELRIRRLLMMTGDHPAAAEHVARAIGCKEVRAQCLPEAKVDIVRAIRREGECVAVVGDGINDAPALASGDIGIAMGAAGSDIAIHSASIALMNNDLRRLPLLVTLSRRTRVLVAQNLALAVLLMIGGMAAASGGWLNPVVAALAHNVGSLLVLFNSARLIRIGEHLESSAVTP